MEKSILILIVSAFLATSVMAQSSPRAVAYTLQFGKADGSGTSNRSDVEMDAIEAGRLSIVQALADQVLETVRIKYTNEADIFICFESAQVGFGASIRNALKTTELYLELLKLNPDEASQVESCDK